MMQTRVCVCTDILCVNSAAKKNYGTSAAGDVAMVTPGTSVVNVPSMAGDVFCVHGTLAATCCDKQQQQQRPPTERRKCWTPPRAGGGRIGYVLEVWW